MAESEAKEEERITELSDLPDAILTHIISLVSDVRTRNSVSLACGKWRILERATRKSLSLRGNVRDLFQLPNCFPSVENLDLSLLSPWGHPFLSDPTNQEIVALRLRQSFPDVTSLTVYARNPSTLTALSPQWPGLSHASLVRWHQRPDHPYGAEIAPLLSSCHNLTSLDLSQFYCWTEDVHHAIIGHPAAAASLTRLNLLSSASAEGFRSAEIVAVASACPNLTHFLASCVFNPRCFGFVGDEAVLDIASGCPRLALLHLADPDTLFGRPEFEEEDSRITSSALEKLFASLPQLEEFALDICHNVRDAGPALEVLGNKCPRMRRLVLGQFQGICKAAGLHLDGLAVCGGLQSLSIKNSADLTDAGLATIARGCRRLSKFEIQGCHGITQRGIKRMAGMLRSTLVEVKIAGCPNLDPETSIRALEPIRDRIERLHLDCLWTTQEAKLSPDATVDNCDLDGEIENDENHIGSSSHSPNKKCRYSDEPSDHQSNGDMDVFWCRTWDRLRYLSLWFPAGEVLSPLREAGLEYCPELEEICIKVEGDCRLRPTMQVFGLSCLASYPKLSKMKLDCGEAIGFALTAPSGHMDLSFWERFYLHGIKNLNLYELDYWPPHDKDVNHRSLSLPATGLIQECATLRKLFIHGTTHEHFMRFFLNMPVLRDVQLREDYYPAPENDMSTEMRVDSCSRFEDTLNNRIIPD